MNKNIDTTGYASGYVCEAACDTEECRFLKDFNSCFLSEDMDSIFRALTDDIVWEMPEDEKYLGLARVKEMFETPPEGMEGLTMEKMVVEQIVADHKGGVSQGYLFMNDGTGFEFADVVTFAPGGDLKIRVMKSFLLPLRKERVR